MYPYAKTVRNPRPTQQQPLPGQIRNSAGGYSFKIDGWARLDRFLILGTEGGSFYATAQKLTRDNARSIQHLLDEDGVRVVNRIVEISLAGRAPKNDPAIFALALAATHKDAEVRKAALTALPQVCRIGTHLFHFIQFYTDLEGSWGPMARRAFQDWYKNRKPDKLVEQLIKYQSRDNWSHRDVIRLSHPKPANEKQKIAFGWAVKGWESVGDAPHPDQDLVKIWAFERAKKASTKELVHLIEEYSLPHECVPNEKKGDPKVWAAMLPNMGITALIRNLGKMSSVGLLKSLSADVRFVVDRLTDVETLKKGRVHPLQLLLAQKIYAQGRGDKGSLTWNPVGKITDALNDAFYLAFQAVEPTGRRYVLGVDVSGSMDGSVIANTSLTAREGAAVMALVTAATEENVEIMGFSHQFVKLDISPKDRLDTVINKMRRLPYGATDCALPMLWASQHDIEADAFCIYSDNDTWIGHVHPDTALQDYRKRFKIPAKLVVVSMTATNCSIANPEDAGQLDVVGFDTATPAVISNFCKE